MIKLVIPLALLVLAHDPEEPFGDWFNTLRSPDTEMSCCNSQRDCGPVDVYEPTDDGYRAYFQGEWVNVPRRVVLERTDNPTGRAVLCVGHLDGQPIARCFVRAAEG
jgi:hypothetical protein